MAHAADRESGGNELAAVAIGGPVAPGTLEKLEEAGIVDGAERPLIQLRRRGDVGQADLLQPPQHIFDAGRPLERGDQLAAIYFPLREMHSVIF